MKWRIDSDVHGAAKWCREMLAAFDRDGADRLLLLGDMLYHGPRNDLPEEYAPKAVLAMLNERRDKILAVRGNCDTEVDQMVLTFPMMADYAVLPPVILTVPVLPATCTPAVDNFAPVPEVVTVRSISVMI